MNNSWKEREKILQDDSRKDFIEKRNKQTKDFGKERIFSLFQEGYTFYKENPSEEKFKFTVGSIIEKIKQQKNKVYLKGTKKKSREAAVEIASLFGKFISLKRDRGDDIFNALGGSLDRVKAHGSQKKNQQAGTQSQLGEVLQQNIVNKADSDISKDLDDLYNDTPENYKYARQYYNNQ
ncbi:hypothetical protein XF24_00840 [candidate division SR1 bacterium Aalborg_AAW-1]|nr:hypothetical protein XF24_00840 [candidate division SR1 bacterium Aalborg_AAW-1]